MGSSAGRPRPRRRLTAAALGLLAVSLVGAVAACGNSSAAGTASDPVTLRLGYFPNLTHATAIVGVQNGIFMSKLGNGVKLEVKTFNAGPEAVEALLSGAIDATYIGPNPTVNAWSKSKGRAVKVVAGAASGGVAFVVKPSITRPEDLKGK